jgi:hypothetical protein
MAIVIEAPGVRQGIRQRIFSGMTERGVPDVMGKAQRLGQILIETKHPGDRSTYLGNFETVSQADAKMIAIGCDKHLCLVPQAPKGNRVNDAITVALKRGPWTASFAKGFQMLPSLAGGRIACVGRSRPHFAATLVTT